MHNSIWFIVIHKLMSYDSFFFFPPSLWSNANWPKLAAWSAVPHFKTGIACASVYWECSEESKLCRLIDWDNSPSLGSRAGWRLCASTPFCFSLIDKAQLFLCSITTREMHMECISVDTLISLCARGQRQTGKVVQRCLCLAITEMPKAFTASVQLWLYIRFCLSPFAFT